jgi:peptidoglycan/LPS O-acetylase OafA/YrhL
MEGMRGFAVTLVFLTHFCTLVAPWLADLPALAKFAKKLHTVGSTGVDLFFVLSGYLIYRMLVTREQPFASFMARRIRRIYPAFVTVFLIYCLLSFVFPHQSSIPDEAPFSYLAANLLLLPGLFPIKPMITVAWSLSYEMFFYLSLPWAISVLHLRSLDGGQRVALIALATIGAVTWGALSDSTHVRMIMFMSGMFVHEAIHSRLVRAPSDAVAAGILATGLLITLLPPAGYMKTVLMFACFYAVCMNCFMSARGRLARMSCWTPIRWLGNMRYSYYLLHGLTLKAFFMLLPQPDILAAHGMRGATLFVLLLPILFVLTLLSSSVLFLLVERPLSLASPSMPVVVAS